jgi:hypothetical protein
MNNVKMLMPNNFRDCRIKIFADSALSYHNVDVYIRDGIANRRMEVL